MNLYMKCTDNERQQIQFSTTSYLKPKSDMVHPIPSNLDRMHEMNLVVFTCAYTASHFGKNAALALMWRQSIEVHLNFI